MNKKKLIPLLGLAGVVAVLGVALVVLTNQPEPAEETAGVALFPEVATGDVTLVHYTTTGDAPLDITLSRPSTAEDAGWTLASDEALPVDQGTAAAVAADVAGMNAARELTDVTASTDMGFDAPTMTFSFTTGEGTYGLTVGAKNTMTNAYYAQIDGSDTVYTIASEDLSSLCKSEKDLYAAQKGTTIATADVTSMTLDNGTAPLNFAKDADGNWTLTDDPAYELDQDLVSRMASTLCGLKSSWTITRPEDKSAYGLDAPDITVTLSTADGTSVTAAFGATDAADSTACYLTTSEQPGVVLEVAAENLSAYTYTKETLRAATPETAESSDNTTAQYPVE